MKKSEFYLVLNNIRSAYNVGSIFRTADGAGVKKIYLCGITPIPKITSSKSQITNKSQIKNPKFQTGEDKIAKTALGAEKHVEWQYEKQTWRLLERLKKEGVKIIALERFDRLTASKLGVKNIFRYKLSSLISRPLALVVGNEVKGLSRKILEYVDDIVEIPMHGKKESLNVSVAVGISLYILTELKK